jgi:hypothetical protein
MGGNVTCMENRKCEYRVLMEKSDRKRPLYDLSIDWKMILKWIF